tara:strand:+ start:132 stop:1484 length:1353 start_codon:yes stop_codon:yes gene_type:complete
VTRVIDDLDKRAGLYSMLPEGQLQTMQRQGLQNLSRGVPPALMELLAVQSAIKAKDTAKASLMAAEQKNVGTIKDKKENELLAKSREEVGLPSQQEMAKGVLGALAVKQRDANKNMKRLANLDPAMIKALQAQRKGVASVKREPTVLAAGGLVPGYFLGGALSALGTIGRSLISPLATSAKLLKPKPKPGGIGGVGKTGAGGAGGTGTALVPYNRSQIGPYLGPKTKREVPLGLGLMTLPFGFMGGLPDEPEEEQKETTTKTTPKQKLPAKTPEGIPEKESRNDALDRLKYVLSTPGGFQNLARAGQQYNQMQLRNELAEQKLNIDEATARAAAKLANVKQQSLDYSKLLASMSTIQGQINEITKDVMDSQLAMTYEQNLEKLRRDPDNESLRAEVQSQEAMLEAAILRRVEAFQKEQGGENLFAQLRAIQRLLYAGDIDRSQPANVVQS